MRKCLQKCSFINKATLIYRLGQIPVIGYCLRKFARLYKEGSVVRIRSGHLAGYKWRRSHRYLSGYWLGSYELPVQKCLVRELKSGEVFFDIGANAGFFSLLGSIQVGQKGHVFAFEPLAHNAETVKAQLELNHISNCTIIEAAVSDLNGKIKLWEGPDTSTAHIGTREDKQRGVKFVNSLTLDEFVQTAAAPDFVKMDIEGAEIRALKGANALLSGSNPPRFLIELHGQMVGRQVCEILEQAGYRFYTLERFRIPPDRIPRHILAFPSDYIK